MSITLYTLNIVPEGDGVTVKRLMPTYALRHADPFVLCDHFNIREGGFPNHPHRGFEAITYLFSGGMNHTDNLGNQGTIHAGGAQRFTAGRGMVHSEFPDGHAHGIQLWINLPKRLKQIEPSYQQVDHIPEQIEQGCTIRTIVGEKGAIDLLTRVEYLDISMPQDAMLHRDIAQGGSGFVYVVEGSLKLQDQQLQTGQAALFHTLESLQLHALLNSRLILCWGQPHHEPILQHGPFVD